MHILHIYKDYFPVLGGIENHLRVLAEGLAARGHRVTVLVTSATPRDEVLRQGGLTIIKAGRALHLASTPLSPRMLLHARRLAGVDLVHLHFPYPPGDLAALAVPGRPPLVVSYHSDIVRQRALLRIYRPLLRHTLDRAARIVATTTAYIAGSSELRRRADRCVAIPLSVDPDRFANTAALSSYPFDKPFDPSASLRAGKLRGSLMAGPLTPSPAPLLLFVGRLRYYKGLHFLIEALGMLRRPARLLIVGVGPEEQRLRAQVAGAGLGDRVRFLGEVSDADLPAVYAAADVFVLPSHLRSEAFGIVQLEAQAAGLPVICTELGTGTSLITRHGETGLVVPPADPAALARAIDLLVADPALARRLGAAGQARAAREFSHRRLLDRIEALYYDILSPL